MTDQIREQLSALLDGELPRDEMGLLMRRLEQGSGAAPHVRLVCADRRNAARPRRADRARRSQPASVPPSTRRRPAGHGIAAARPGATVAPAAARRALEATDRTHRTRCQRGRHGRAVVPARSRADRAARNHAGQFLRDVGQPDAGAEPASRRLHGRAQPVLDADGPSQRAVEPPRRRPGHHARIVRDGRGSLAMSRPAMRRAAALRCCLPAGVFGARRR